VSIIKEVANESLKPSIKLMLYLFIVFILLIGSSQFSRIINYYYYFKPYNDAEFSHIIIFNLKKPFTLKNRTYIERIENVSITILEEVLDRYNAVVALYPLRSWFFDSKQGKVLIKMIIVTSDVNILRNFAIPFDESLSSDGFLFIQDEIGREPLDEVKNGKLIEGTVISQIGLNKLENISLVYYKKPSIFPTSIIIVDSKSRLLNRFREKMDLVIWGIYLINPEEASMLLEFLKIDKEFTLSLFSKSEYVNLSISNLDINFRNLVNMNNIFYWVGIILGVLIVLRNMIGLVESSKTVISLYYIYGVSRIKLVTYLIIWSFILLLIVLVSSTILSNYIYSYLVGTEPIPILDYINLSIIFLSTSILPIFLVAIYSIHRLLSMDKIEEYVSTGVM